jgi:hypothetical protein
VKSKDFAGVKIMPRALSNILYRVNSSSNDVHNGVLTALTSCYNMRTVDLQSKCENICHASDAISIKKTAKGMQLHVLCSKDPVKCS